MMFFPANETNENRSNLIAERFVNDRLIDLLLILGQ